MGVVNVVRGVFIRGGHQQFRWQCRGCAPQRWGPQGQTKAQAAAGALAHAQTVHAGWAPQGPPVIGRPMAYSGRDG